MAQGVHLRKYGVQTTIDFELYEIDGVDLRTDWVPAAADCEVMKDEGASTQCTNTATDEGSTYSIVLTATEMQAARLVLKVVDAATKVVLDKVIFIETYGNASAEHAFDLDTATQDVNVSQISGDSTAADNLELMYDGTGYTDDTAPASRQQVGNLSVGTGGIATIASSATVTVGTETLTYTATAELDGTVHEVAVDTTIDFYYEFDIGGSGIPISITWEGYVQTAGDNVEVHFYNWAGASWDQVGQISGSPSTTVGSATFSATTAHVGTGANLGTVRFRFTSDGADVATNVATDRILVTYTVSNQSIGYEDGAVWIDTNASNTNTESFVDGTADNPVSTIAAALTLAGNLNINHFHVSSGSSITLGASVAGYIFEGHAYTIALNGQNVSGTIFENATITGNDTGSNAISTHYHTCMMGSNTLGAHEFNGCSLSGDIVLAEAADYFWDQCYSAVAGTGTPSVDFEL
jgi:hypothetical protein